jgi:hypothetical protein
LCNAQCNRAQVILAALVAGLLLGAAWLVRVFWDLPAAEIHPEAIYQTSERITDRKSILLYEIIPEGAELHTVLPWRMAVWMEWSDISARASVLLRLVQHAGIRVP